MVQTRDDWNRPPQQQQPAPTGARGAGPPVGPDGRPSPTAQGGGGGLGANPQGANMIRYPTQNPRFAMQSAMLDKGANPFRADPYMSMLMNYAPGLASAFMMGNLGQNAQSIAGQGGEGKMFGDYLSGVLGQGGGLGSALSGATAGMGGTLRQLTEMQDKMAGSGQSMQDMNPFAQYLMDIMADPQGAAGLYGSLTTPFMSGRVGQSYTGGLQDQAGMALRQRGNDLNQSGNPRNFWDYLFPGI